MNRLRAPLALFAFAACCLGLRAAPAALLDGAFAVSTRVDQHGLHALGSGVAAWDSWQGSDANQGVLRIGPFPAPRSLEVAICGYPSHPGIALYLLRDDGVRLDLHLRFDPGEQWSRLRWSLPKSWTGRRITLVAEDRSRGSGDWIGVSEPLAASSQIGPALRLGFLQALVFAGLLLPGFALSLLIEADPLRRLCWTLLLSGLASYLEFFAVFLHPAAGPSLSLGLFGVSMAVMFARRHRLAKALCSRDVLTALGLALLVCLFYAEGSFLYGGIEAPQVVSLSRLGWELPMDPLLPHWFAAVVVHGRPVHPFAGDWLTSDRPPLQAALEVMLHPALPGELGPALVGIAAQAWVWIGFWVFLRSLPLNAWQRSLVLVSCVFSGFFFLNSIFYWPKLLPAGYLLAAAGLLWRTDDGGRLSVRTASLAAACLAMSLLAHGGSFFGIAGMAVVYLVQRGQPGWRAFLAGTCVVAAVMSPWILYQRLADPPGDRLVKFHLAGHPAIDPRPSLTVIREAYARTPWPHIVENKLVNVQTLFFRQAGWWDNTRQSFALLQAGRVRDAFAVFSRASRIAGFFHYGQTLACLLPAVFGSLWLLVSRRGSDLEKAVRLAAGLTLASCVVWCLMMFSAGTTVIHQGSYFTGACLFTAVALGLSAFPRWVTRLILGANLLWFFAIWMIAAQPMPYEAGKMIFPSAIPGFTVCIAVLCMALLAFLHRLSTDSDLPKG